MTDPQPIGNSETYWNGERVNAAHRDVEVEPWSFRPDDWEPVLQEHAKRNGWDSDAS